MIFMSANDSSGGASQASVDALAVSLAALAGVVDALALAVAALPVAPTLTRTTGTLTPADSIIIPAVGGQVIKVFAFMLWSNDGAARKLAYSDADGFTDLTYYHVEDLILFSNGLGDALSTVLPMSSPAGQPLYTTPSGKTFSAVGDGNLQYMIWFTQE